jgi:hypothetical protein
MYTLIKELSPRHLLWLQTPAFLLSFVIASLFYKFGSFVLECLAFLVTWFVIDFTIVKLREIVSPGPSEHTEPPGAERR